MKDNKKLEEFLDTKVGELGKKYFERFVEEGKKIVENAKEEFNKIVEEDNKEDSVVTGPLELQDLSNKYDELVRITVDTFNRMLKENGVDTDLYSLNYQDCLNEKIFGDDLLNCTIQGILNQNCNEDLLIELLKIAGRVCKAVESEDLELVKITRNGYYDDCMLFNLLFRDNKGVHTILVECYDYDSLSFNPGKDIFINSNIRSSFSVEGIIALNDSTVRIGNSPHSDIFDIERNTDYQLNHISISNFSAKESRDLPCLEDETYNEIGQIIEGNRYKLTSSLRFIAHKIDEEDKQNE